MLSPRRLPPRALPEVRAARRPRPSEGERPRLEWDHSRDLPPRLPEEGRVARRPRGPEERPRLERVNSRGHSISLEVKDALSVAFGLLQNHSLQHAACQQMDDARVRKAAIAASAHGGAPRGSNGRRQLYRAPSVSVVVEATTPRGDYLEEEPEVTNISDWVMWREWATRRARAAAALAHPRGHTALGTPIELPLNVPMGELAEATGGVATRLYFDTLRLVAGVCALGFLLSLPAIVFSAMHQYASLRATGLLTSADLFGAMHRPRAQLGLRVGVLPRPPRSPGGVGG